MTKKIVVTIGTIGHVNSSKTTLAAALSNMLKESVIEREKECYCFTCQKDFHSLGIASHRAMHRNRHETCLIGYTDGRTITHDFSKRG
jgi:uncharacterized UBP type Zn finger protein